MNTENKAVPNGLLGELEQVGETDCAVPSLPYQASHVTVTRKCKMAGRGTVPVPRGSPREVCEILSVFSYLNKWIKFCHSEKG